MKIHFNNLNKAGLSEQVIQDYKNSIKVRKYVKDMENGDTFPDIHLYKNTNTIADGIHRICAYLTLGVYEFEFQWY